MPLNFCTLHLYKDLYSALYVHDLLFLLALHALLSHSYPFAIQLNERDKKFIRREIYTCFKVTTSCMNNKSFVCEVRAEKDNVQFI